MTWRLDFSEPTLRQQLKAVFKADVIRTGPADPRRHEQEQPRAVRPLLFPSERATAPTVGDAA